MEVDILFVFGLMFFLNAKCLRQKDSNGQPGPLVFAGLQTIV